MRQNRPTAARAIAVFALIALCILPSFGQDDGVQTIAVVSLARIQSEYTLLHDQERNLGQWLQSRKDYHDQLTNFMFLPKKEFEEALELMSKPRPLSEADQTRLQELRGISDENDERHAELRAKPDRTAQETAEFNALQDMYDASAEVLKGIQQSIMSELGDRRETALAGLMDTVEQAVIDTAREAGYDLVLDSDMVLYGGDNITGAVIKRLNQDAGTTETGGEQGEQGGEAGGEETTGEQGG